MARVIFAVGGTGGHLFPAQALAKELRDKIPGIEILFAGGGLSRNPFFKLTHFPFQEITSGTPYLKRPFRAAGRLLLGIFQSFKLCKNFKPDFLVGFGSFYSFPLLCVARLFKIPYLLVDPNALPGKVNRLFAKKARFTAVQFEEARSHLKGETVLTLMPQFSKELDDAYLLPTEARKYFGLDPDCFTLLVFGGSQGAQTINRAVKALELSYPFQTLHFCGRGEDPKKLLEHYAKRGIKACVRPFEEKMHLAWRAADFAICRAGGGTLSELIKFSVPGLLVPWPKSSEDHQLKNARALEKSKGVHVLEEGELGNLSKILEKRGLEREGMQKQLNTYKEKYQQTLCEMVSSQTELKK